MTIDGVVVAFDAQRGDGTIRADDGEEFYFHCVTIADGTRSVNAGARISATRHVGLLGRDEASDLVKV